MTINKIQNLEAGGNVREKLNAVIDAANEVPNKVAKNPYAVAVLLSYADSRGVCGGNRWRDPSSDRRGRTGMDRWEIFNGFGAAGRRRSDDPALHRPAVLDSGRSTVVR